jgi:hypothetical protein
MPPPPQLSAQSPMTPWKQCLVAPQGECFCVTLAWLSGSAYYYTRLWKPLAADILYHTEEYTELLASHVMLDHATFLNYVIASRRMSWPQRPACSRLIESKACVA